MQDVIEKRYGKRPTLFRPPYGNYNEDTLRAAKSCGIKAAPCGTRRSSSTAGTTASGTATSTPATSFSATSGAEEHWKGTMPDMVRRFLNTVTDKGYAVARLEDYL